jgi:hypothetical protein
MLAGLIAGHVERGMEHASDRAVDAPTTPQTSAPGGDGTWPGGHGPPQPPHSSSGFGCVPLRTSADGRRYADRRGRL